MSPSPPSETGGDPGRVPSERLALLTPALLVIALGAVLALFDGGFQDTLWHPVALFALALLVLVLVVAPPAGGDRSRGFDVALLLFGLFTLWSYASILWADMPSDAWSGANRTLLYWLAFALIGLRPWPPGAANAALGLVAFGLALVAGGTLLVTTGADDASELFLGGRLAEPIGYANATANLWLIGIWPALHLALARDVVWPVRGLGLAAATVLLEIALLSQSRGAMLAFLVTAVAFVVLYPRHWAALAALAVPVLALAIGWDTLTEVRNAQGAAELESLLGDARGLVLLSAAIALVLGMAAALLDGLARRRLPASSGRRRTLDLSFFAVAAVCLVGFVAVAASSTDWIDSRWEEFRSGDYAAVEGSDNRFGALGSGRYDFYRVSLNEWRDNPLAGTGGENFAVPYLQQRRTREAPRYAHSLGFSVLSTLGLVGAIAWLSHAMVDWLWEYPSLTLLGVGLLAIAARTSDRDPVTAPGGSAWPLRTLPGRAVLGLLAVAAAVSLALPGAAARFERSGYRALATDPETAVDRLSRAADLDPLDADALIGRSVLVRRAGRVDEARADLREAIEREPENWFAHFELALLEAEARRFGAAERSVDRAGELNPGQALIREVGDRIRAGRKVDAAAIERALSGQLSTRLQPFDSD